MGSKVMIMQHPPLRTPDGWNAQEKMLITQLETILDDIYKHFGRLNVRDMAPFDYGKTEVKSSTSSGTTYTAETDGWYLVACDAADSSHGIAMGEINMTNFSSMTLPIRKGTEITLKGASGTATTLYRLS